MHRRDFPRFLGPLWGKTAGSFPEWVKPKPHLLREQIQFIQIRNQGKANPYLFSF